MRRRGIIKVVTRVVEGVPCISIAVADEKITTGHFFEHEGEVFGASSRRQIYVNIVFSDQTCTHAGCERGLRLVIYDRMKDVPKIECDRCAVTLGR